MAIFYPETTIPSSGTSTRPGTPIVWTEKINTQRSPKFTLEADRSTCTRVVDVSWDWLENFAQSVMGYQSLSTLRISDSYSHVPTSLAYPYISRVAPWAANFGNSPNPDFLYASKFDAEGLGVPLDRVCIDGTNEDAVARYQNARCTITFTTRTYDILTDSQMYALEPTMDESSWRRYVTRLIRPSGEIFTFQAGDGGFFYSFGAATSSTACQTGINKLVISYNWAVTWHQIPIAAVPSNLYNPGCVNPAIDNCLGTVNSTTFQGAKQGQLLLLAVEIKPMVSPLGERIFDITYMFKFFAPGMKGYPEGYHYSPVPNFTIFAGHNHVLVPPVKIPTTSTLTSNWYEVLSDKTIAASTTPTNFIAKTDGLNIYDFREFRNLFRPATYNL